MKVTYQAKDYNPELPYKQYIRYDSDRTFRWCEKFLHSAWDVRQGTVHETELDESFRNEVVDAKAIHCHYLDWPR